MVLCAFSKKKINHENKNVYRNTRKFLFVLFFDWNNNNNNKKIK